MRTVSDTSDLHVVWLFQFVAAMIFVMYITKHLRGNAILEASHNNDSFDLLTLAQALIKREVSVTGVFLRVE